MDESRKVKLNKGAENYVQIEAAKGSPIEVF